MFWDLGHVGNSGRFSQSRAVQAVRRFRFEVKAGAHGSLRRWGPGRTVKDEIRVESLLVNGRRCVTVCFNCFSTNLGLLRGYVLAHLPLGAERGSRGVGMASRVEGVPAAASKATSIALGHRNAMPRCLQWCWVDSPGAEFLPLFSSRTTQQTMLDLHARMPRGRPCLERGL